MKSVKETAIENKIIEKLKNFPECLMLVKCMLEDEELQEMQEYANIVSIKRLGYNDHGPVHMRQVALNSIKMLNILHEAGIQTSLEKEETGSFEDSLSAVVAACLMHDLGMTTGRESHEKMSAMFAMPMIDRFLKKVFPSDIHKQVIIKALAAESIVGHMTSRKVYSMEAGTILVADGCDMTKGRARIPLSMNQTPHVGDIHKYSANAVTHVGIHHGENKPIKIDVEMSSEVGFFQIEEVLFAKIDSSPVKPYIELYAGVKGCERKCYL